MSTNLDLNDPALWPEWATGLAEGRVQLGAQLRTRDGRMFGNAVVVGEKAARGGVECWQVRTDAGNVVFLTDGEISDAFWPPEWLMDPANTPQQRSGTTIPPAIPRRLIDLSAKASPDWALPSKSTRFAHGLVLGDAVQKFANGSSQTQIACFSSPLFDVHDARDPVELQAANAEFAVECVRFVRESIASQKDGESGAVRACRALVNAYKAGREAGGSIDWSDVDEAHALALAALGME